MLNAYKASTVILLALVTISSCDLSAGTPNIVPGFSCDGLKYGYYADVFNDCRVFHICNPYVTSDNFIITDMHSFMCGEGTVFNQASLVCDYPYNSIPCLESPNHYDINDYFGRTDVNFRER